jgi:hypothetical protein
MEQKQSSVSAEGTVKAVYAAPRLVEYGDVKKLTEKRTGSTDLMSGKKMII